MTALPSVFCCKSTDLNGSAGGLMGQEQSFNHNAFHYFKERSDEFPFLQISGTEDECSCFYCRSQAGKILKTADAKIAMIPPFSECASVKCKCRCTFIAIDKQQALRLRLQ
jgi:hypothetical protein